MFNIGIPEIALLLAIALIFIGPKKLPDTARSVGRGIRKAKQVMAEIMGVWDSEINKLDNEIKNPQTKATEHETKPEQKTEQKTEPAAEKKQEEKDSEDTKLPGSDYFSSL